MYIGHALEKKGLNRSCGYIIPSKTFHNYRLMKLILSLDSKKNDVVLSFNVNINEPFVNSFGPCQHARTA